MSKLIVAERNDGEQIGAFTKKDWNETRRKLNHITKTVEVEMTKKEMKALFELKYDNEQEYVVRLVELLDDTTPKTTGPRGHHKDPRADKVLSA